jgi:solute carrier family 36 (proton-coupled amino acid transporter)
VLGTIVFLCIAFVIFETMKMIFSLADSYNKEGMTFPKLAELHFGRKG